MFTNESKFSEIVMVAKVLEVNHVKIKKPVLVENVNAALEAKGLTVEEVLGNINKGDDELENPIVDQEVQEEVKRAKWYEEEGAYPYNEGDVVIITNINKHKGLIGRKVEVVKPSAKKNALKGYLLHPVNGQRQNTLITLMFDYVELFKEDAPTETEAEATTAV